MALTKVSRGLLSTGIVDNSNATAITLNADESATFAGGVDVTGTATATKLVSTNGVLELDDNGSHNGVINSPASLFVNIDSDANSAGEDFVIGKDRTSTSGGTELLRVQEDGKVGIGVSSLNNPLEVAVTPNTASKTSGSAFDGAAIRLSGNLSTTNSEAAIIAGLDGGIQAGIGFMRESISSWGSAIKFYTRQAAVVDLDGVAERFRITSAGDILFNTTTLSNGSNNSMSYSNTGDETLIISSAGTGGSYMIRFMNGNGAVGQIISSGSTTSYGVSSDYRLKENVVAMSGATERLKQLNPSRFNFIADADTTVDGFLAHEVQDVVPEAITGTKDAMRDEEYEVTPAVLDDDGNVTTEAVMGTRSVPDYQGIDQSKLVPLLVATIQELEARLTALENN